MRRSLPTRTAAIAGLALTASVACTPAESEPTAPVVAPHVELELSAARSGIAPCRIEQVARNDQAALGVRVLRGHGLYRAPDGAERGLPLQIRFEDGEGVVEARDVTRPRLDTDCAGLTVALSIERCTSIDRLDMPCPEVRVSGQDAFAGVRLNVVE